MSRPNPRFHIGQIVDWGHNVVIVVAVSGRAWKYHTYGDERIGYWQYELGLHGGIWADERTLRPHHPVALPAYSGNPTTADQESLF